MKTYTNAIIHFNAKAYFFYKPYPSSARAVQIIINAVLHTSGGFIFFFFFLHDLEARVWRLTVVVEAERTI